MRPAAAAFKIRNVRSAKILDLDGASLADGAKIQQWTDSGVNHQQWRLQPVGDYFIRTTNGKYICYLRRRQHQRHPHVLVLLGGQPVVQMAL